MNGFRAMNSLVIEIGDDGCCGINAEAPAQERATRTTVAAIFIAIQFLDFFLVRMFCFCVGLNGIPPRGSGLCFVISIHISYKILTYF
jgi:hypothetical protein